MKVDVPVLVRILGKFLPAIRLFAAALNRESDGGKKITPAERDEVIAALIAVVDTEAPV